MKEIILYPPNGDDVGVVPHNTKIEEMKANGWVEKKPTKKIAKKIKENEDGDN